MREWEPQKTFSPQSGPLLGGESGKGEPSELLLQNPAPTKPQTLSIFSGTKHVCGMRSSTQLPLEQEHREWGGREVGFPVPSAAPDSSL